MKNLTLPHSTRVAIAAGRKTPRYLVGFYNGNGAYIGVPEHNPTHREAKTAALMLGTNRVVIEGVTYVVQEA